MSIQAQLAPLPPWEETPAQVARADRDYWARDLDTDDEPQEYDA